MNCVHYMLVETPSGPTVHAVCRKCGLEREYPSSDVELWKKQRGYNNVALQKPQSTMVSGTRRP